MPRKPQQNLSEASWFRPAAELIVREGKRPLAAFTEVGASITTQEAEAIFRSKTFQKIIWAERQKFYKELANTPGRSKDSAIGLLYQLAQGLIDAGDLDKAANVVEKIMKAEGWTGPESQVNVFHGLSPKDYEKLKAELEAINAAEQKPKKVKREESLVDQVMNENPQRVFEA